MGFMLHLLRVFAAIVFYAFGAGAAIAVSAVGCIGTSGLGCAVIVGGAALAESNTIYDGAATVITGSSQDGYIKNTLLAAGFDDADADQYERWIETGLAVATISVDGVLVIRSTSGALLNTGRQTVDDFVRVGNNVPDVPEGMPYYRVQGGGSGTATSREALTVNTDGTVSITPGCTGTICVSAGSPDHAAYYISERRPDGNVVVFEVDRATHNQIMEVAVPQRNNGGAPVQIVDETTSGNATSLQLDQVHSQLMTSGSSNGRVLTQQEFLDEFGGN